MEALGRVKVGLYNPVTVPPCPVTPEAWSSLHALCLASRGYLAQILSWPCPVLIAHSTSGSHSLSLVQLEQAPPGNTPVPSLSLSVPFQKWQ